MKFLRFITVALLLLSFGPAIGAYMLTDCDEILSGCLLSASNNLTACQATAGSVKQDCYTISNNLYNECVWPCGGDPYCQQDCSYAHQTRLMGCDGQYDSMMWACETDYSYASGACYQQYWACMG